MPTSRNEPSEPRASDIINQTKHRQDASPVGRLRLAKSTRQIRTLPAPLTKQHPRRSQGQPSALTLVVDLRDTLAPRRRLMLGARWRGPNSLGKIRCDDGNFWLVPLELLHTQRKTRYGVGEASRSERRRVLHSAPLHNRVASSDNTV